MIALVGVSISGMPGPPLGPSYRITITAPCRTRRCYKTLCWVSEQLSAQYASVLAWPPENRPGTQETLICRQGVVGAGHRKSGQHSWSSGVHQHCECAVTLAHNQHVTPRPAAPRSHSRGMDGSVTLSFWGSSLTTAIMSSSESKTLAGPRNCSPSLPVIFATLPCAGLMQAVTKRHRVDATTVNAEEHTGVMHTVLVGAGSQATVVSVRSAGPSQLPQRHTTPSEHQCQWRGKGMHRPDRLERPHTCGARLPYRIWMCPLSLIGVSSGTITFCPSVRSGQSFRFSANDLPAHPRDTRSVVSGDERTWAGFQPRMSTALVEGRLTSGLGSGTMFENGTAQWSLCWQPRPEKQTATMASNLC